MIKLIRKPNIDMQVGIRVYKDTELTYESEYVKQEIKDLVLHSITTVKGDGFKSTYDTRIELKEGDVLVFEEDSRGYIKPVEEFMTITEAIEELNNIKDLDTEV